MQVRYQAALRPVKSKQPLMIQHCAVAENAIVTDRLGNCLALEDVQQFFQLYAHLPNDLLALADVFLGFFP
jgi:hypothetical protein